MISLFNRGGRAIGLAFFVCACRAAPAGPASHHVMGEAFGTTWNVKWTGPFAEELVLPVIVGQLEEVDAAMSTWREDSELSRLRRSPEGLDVSPITLEVISEALRIARLTDGAFDPTVEALVELWTIHGERRLGPPSPNELATARAQVGWKKMTVSGSHVTLNGTALDLSAIAKGFGVDQISEGLAELGVQHFLVEVGGEVRVRGLNPSGRSWTLGVDDPVVAGSPGSHLAALLAPGDGALATSGNYRNHFRIGGQEVVHTLDPRVGRPVQSDVLSASVLAPSCATADGWATALMVLGTAGLPIIERQVGVEALLIVVGGSQVQTSGLESYRVTLHP